MIIHAVFEIDAIIRCRVRALLLLIPCELPLTYWRWKLVIHSGSRDQFLHQVWRSCAYPCL